LFFNITSKNPLNPDNLPDAFELEAINKFENGAKEFYREEMIGQKEYFRYMAPLVVNEGCLGCHAGEGYSVGDYRGGISVSIDVGHTKGELKKNFFMTLALAVLSAAALLSAVLYFSGNLIEHINRSRLRIQELITMDDLTGVYNRRHLLTRFEEEFQQAQRLDSGLGCVMFDLDRFKEVNDKYGHLAGDEVLRRFAGFLHDSIRAYDVLGRFGGEEFLVALPATDHEETWNFAERMREQLENMDIELDSGRKLRITVSAGVTVMTGSDSSMLDIVNRADEAMYRAKRDGRNKVV